MKNYFRFIGVPLIMSLTRHFAFFVCLYALAASTADVDPRDYLRREHSLVKPYMGNTMFKK